MTQLEKHIDLLCENKFTPEIEELCLQVLQSRLPQYKHQIEVLEAHIRAMEAIPTSWIMGLPIGEISRRVEADCAKAVIKVMKKAIKTMKEHIEGVEQTRRQT